GRPPAAGPGGGDPPVENPDRPARAGVRLQPGGARIPGRPARRRGDDRGVATAGGGADWATAFGGPGAAGGGPGRLAVPATQRRGTEGGVADGGAGRGRPRPLGAPGGPGPARRPPGPAGGGPTRPSSCHNS